MLLIIWKTRKEITTPITKNNPIQIVYELLLEEPEHHIVPLYPA